MEIGLPPGKVWALAPKASNAAMAIKAYFTQFSC
jgi:hypothetical protein